MPPSPKIINSHESRSGKTEGREEPKNTFFLAFGLFWGVLDMISVVFFLFFVFFCCVALALSLLVWPQSALCEISGIEEYR